MISDRFPAMSEASAGEIRIAGWVGLVVNLLLAACKVAAGVVANSQAVVADGVHSLSDLVTDVALILGVRYWTAPADESHPHGHHRIETAVTLGIGIVLALVAVGIGYQAMHGIVDGDHRTPGPIALVAALASIAIKEWLYRWTRTRGERHDSPALVANAWHHRSDALSSLPAALAVGAALIDPAWAFVDKIGALVVAVFILYAAHRILKPALAELVDTAAPSEVISEIEALAVSVDGVAAAHAIRTRYIGPRLAVDLHVEVDGGLTVAEGHGIARQVKRRLLARGPKVADVLVQIEPAHPREAG